MGAPWCFSMVQHFLQTVAPAPAHLAARTQAMVVLWAILSLKVGSALQAGAPALDGWAGARLLAQGTPLGAGAASLPEMSLLGATGVAAVLPEIGDKQLGWGCTFP